MEEKGEKVELPSVQPRKAPAATEEASPLPSDTSDVSCNGIRTSHDYHCTITIIISSLPIKIVLDPLFSFPLCVSLLCLCSSNVEKENVWQHRTHLKFDHFDFFFLLTFWDWERARAGIDLRRQCLACPTAQVLVAQTTQLVLSGRVVWATTALDKKKKKKKKRTIPEIRGEKNAVPPCHIMLDHTWSAQRKSRGWPRPALIARDQAWYHKIEQCSSHRESRGWFFFLSRVVTPWWLGWLGTAAVASIPTLALSQSQKPNKIFFSFSNPFFVCLSSINK